MNGTIKPNAIKIEFTQEEFRIFLLLLTERIMQPKKYK